MGVLAGRPHDSSTRRTRSACSRRCCSPGGSPTRSGAVPAARRARDVGGCHARLHGGESVVWLFVARAVQGLATGLALGAASAAMLDLHPRRDPAGVGLANGVVSAGGMGLGVLVSAAFVELAPAPLVLPYVALFVLFAITLVGVPGCPSRSTPLAAATHPAAPTGAGRGAAALRAGRARRHVLVVDRRPVPVARPAADGDACSDTTTTSSPAPACSPWGRPPRSRRSCSGAPRRGPGQPRGSIVLAAGLAADRARRLDRVERRLPRRRDHRRRRLRRRVPRRAARAVGRDPPQHRAEVMSAFYVVAYSALSLPAIATGVPGHAARPSGRRSRSSAASSPRWRWSSPAWRGGPGRSRRRRPRARPPERGRVATGGNR